MPPDVIMGASFIHNLGTHASNIAAIDQDGKQITYSELLKHVDDVKRFVGERCLIALICENSIDCLEAYVTLISADCALLLLHRTVTPEQLTSIADKFQPKYIATPTAFSLSGTEKKDLGGYTIQRTTYAADYPLHDELFLLLTTSGTTGSRSFVRQSYRNVQANAKSIVEYLGLTASDRAITTMPMNYTYGLSIIHSHLLAGASMVMTEASLVSPTFWKLIKDAHVTNFGGVPFVYEMLKKLRFATMQLPSLRLMTQAGGKLSPELVTEFSKLCAQKNIHFVVMYGQTEATARMAYLPWQMAPIKPASIGIAIPGGRFELRDEGGQVVESPDTAADLIYSGDNVSLGYAKDFADLAKGDENARQLATGDIAMRDKDGFYSIVGRKKRFLKVFGYRVSLDEVEQILKNAGYDCACGGTDDRLAIYTAGSGDNAIIKSVMSDKTNLTPQGYTVIEVEAIPRNESGKIDYARLKAMTGT